MKKKFAALTFGYFALFALSPAMSASIFVEDQGKVVIEMESANAGAGWSFENTISNYKGTGYYVWKGADLLSSNKAGQGGTITYHFRISKPGNYELRWRSYIAKGNSRSDSNDSWARFPTGKNISGEHALTGWTKVYMNTFGDWSWSAKTVDRKGYRIRQYFGAGDHSIEVSGRSNGHAIDRIVLYKYDELNYSASTFDEFAESDTTTGSNPTPAPQPQPQPVEPDKNTEEEPEPAPDSDTEDTATEVPEEPAMHDLAPNICENNEISLTPLDDVSRSGNSVNNGSKLAFSGTGDTALLRFDLSAMPATIKSVSFDFLPVENTKNKSSTIVIHSTHHAEWIETSEIDQLPDPSLELAHAAINFGSNKIKSVSLRHNLLSGDIESLSLSLANNEELVNIAASESISGPRLHISGEEGFCDSFDSPEQEQPESNSTNIDQESGNVDETDQLTPETAAATEPSDINFGGSASHITLLSLMIFLGIRIQTRTINSKKLQRSTHRRAEH